MSRELEIEQLQSDIASLGRIQDVMQNEIHRAQDELCCMTHKSKHFELEVTFTSPTPLTRPPPLPHTHTHTEKTNIK